MLDKERQYKGMYVPEHLIEEREKSYWKLLDIDCNFSKLLCLLFVQIRELANYIYEEGKNYRHFNWRLTLEDPKTGEIFYVKECKDGTTEVKSESKNKKKAKPRADKGRANA